MKLVEIRQFVEAGDIERVRDAVDVDPYLLHTSDPDPELWEERTLLHSATGFAGNCSDCIARDH